MNILVIDTATEACSVALQYDGRVVSRYEVCPQEHSQKLLPMVDDVLKEANVKLNQLDCLGFGRGPGSFTGVRIATGMIQGLSLGTNIPVVGISTLAAMAQQVIEQTQDSAKVSVAIDARMSEVYYAEFENINGKACLHGNEQVCSPDFAAQASKTFAMNAIAGSGWKAYTAFEAITHVMQPSVEFPNARFMIKLAQDAYQKGNTYAASEIEPVYLRDKVTWKKLPGR